MLRRNKDRDERLRALQEEATGLCAEAKRLEQQRAQLEAELAEAHRERCGSTRYCQSPVLVPTERAALLCTAIMWCAVFNLTFITGPEDQPSCAAHLGLSIKAAIMAELTSVCCQQARKKCSSRVVLPCHALPCTQEELESPKLAACW